MKLGDYTLYSIETSEFGLDGGAMFGIIPKPLWEKQSPADEKNRISMVTRSLLLVSNERKILIDTGNGTKWEEKFKNIYNINTSRYSIEYSLSKYGFTCDMITDVICTHLHFDHVGGNTKIENGKIVPTFQNAKYWVSKENWQLANSPSQKDGGSFMDIDWKVSYLTYGHTLGLMHLIISDTNQSVFYGSDLFPTISHIPVPWVMSYDIQPLVTINEKEILLKKFIEEDWILFFEHDPNVQACTIENDNNHYKLKKSIIISE